MKLRRFTYVFGRMAAAGIFGLATASLCAQANDVSNDSSAPPDNTATSPTSSSPIVVAIVNERSLLSAEVDQVLEQLSFQDQTSQQRKQAIDLAVQRLLVLDYLKDRKLGATGPEIELAMTRWEQHLAARKVSATDYYRANDLNESALRRRFEWKIGWDRYRNKHLADASLAKFYAKHRDEFDGTRRKVAHILLSTRSDEDATMEIAIDLRAKIKGGELSFFDAAKQFSIGTTADRGGELGWISAVGPMTPAFTHAAFGLDVDQLSMPTRSPFGVHLIRCLEIEPGELTLADVLPKVRKAAELHLFRAAVKKQRPKSSVALR